MATGHPDRMRRFFILYIEYILAPVNRPANRKVNLMIELETQRLHLRNGSNVRPSPAELRRDYERYVVEHEDPSTTFEQYADENIFAFLNARRGSVFGYYVIYPKGLDTWVGHCSFYPLLCQPALVRVLDGTQDPPPHASLEFEIGWAISTAYRNQGYATEGAKALLAYGFGTLQARRIIALTEHDNQASMRVMEKLGMTLRENPADDGIIGIISDAGE